MQASIIACFRAFTGQSLQRISGLNPASILCCARDVWPGVFMKILWNASRTLSLCLLTSASALSSLGPATSEPPVGVSIPSSARRPQKQYGSSSASAILQGDVFSLTIGMPSVHPPNTTCAQIPPIFKKFLSNTMSLHKSGKSRKRCLQLQSAQWILQRIAVVQCDQPVAR